VSTLVSDFAAFSDSVSQYLSRPSDTLATTDLPQSPRTRLAVTLDDFQRLGVEFRRELNNFGAKERSVWKRLIGDELTRRFYERLRSDVASFSTHQLREFADSPPSDWLPNYERDDDSPGGAGSQLASVEGRYALLNADVPMMDLAVVNEHVTRELAYYADALELDNRIKVKVEDMLTKLDDLTSNVESLRSDCGLQSDNDFNNLIR